MHGGGAASVTTRLTMKGATALPKMVEAGRYHHWRFHLSAIRGVEGGGPNASLVTEVVAAS